MNPGLKCLPLSVAPAQGGGAADRSGYGAEGDRPLFVFRRLDVGPGAHVLRVHFTPVGGGSDTLRLDTTIALASRRVALVTLDQDLGRLVVRTALP